MPAWDVLYQSILTSSYASQTMQNVLWFRTRTTSPNSTVESELTDVHSNVNAWFVTNLVNFCNVGWSPRTLVTKVMAGALEYQAISNYTNVFGAKTGDGMPPHDAVVVSLYTQFHGRRLHGRIYIGGLSESDHNNGLLTSPAFAGLQAIGADLMTRFSQGGSFGSAWGTVFSRANGTTRNPGPPPHIVYDPLAALPWVRMTVSNRICTQRHRIIH